MNDNMSQATTALAKQREALALAANAATNGRWGMAGMGAIALYIDQPKLAFAFVLIILASHLAEAMLSARLLPIVYAALACWGAISVVLLAVLI